MRDYPSIELFEQHQGIKRRFDQRPHNRYYLAFGESIHHASDRPARGIARPEDIAPSWKTFIDELETGPYRQFVARLLDGIEVVPRYD